MQQSLVRQQPCCCSAHSFRPHSSAPGPRLAARLATRAAVSAGEASPTKVCPACLLPPTAAVCLVAASASLSLIMHVTAHQHACVLQHPFQQPLATATQVSSTCHEGLIPNPPFVKPLLQSQEEVEREARQAVTRRIKQLGAQRKVKEAIKELASLAQLGIEPDTQAATALVAAAVQSRNMSLAHDLFQELFGEWVSCRANSNISICDNQQKDRGGEGRGGSGTAATASGRGVGRMLSRSSSGSRSGNNNGHGSKRRQRRLTIQ